MTGYEHGTMTPDKVKKLATERATLPRTALIGIFGLEANLAALIRNPGGSISKITVGDKAAGGTVAAIGLDRVVITKKGYTSVLNMPKS